MLVDLPAQPCLADGIELVRGPGEFLQLRGCSPPIRLTGRMAHRLMPLLDGAHSLDAITTALAEWPPDQVLGAMRMLAEQGLVGDGSHAPDLAERSQAAFYWAATTGPADRGEQTRQTLAAARIQLFGWGSLLEELAGALRRSGAQRLAVEAWRPPAGVQAAHGADAVSFPTPDELEQRFPASGQADLVLLALPRAAPALAEAANTASLSRGVPWLPVVTGGTEAVIGPAVLPGRSACYHCFTQRLKSNTPFPDEDSAYDAHLGEGASGVIQPDWPAFTAAIAGLAAMEAIRLVTQFTPAVTAGKVLFVDAGTGSQRNSWVWKLPRCPECLRRLGGDPDERPA